MKIYTLADVDNWQGEIHSHKVLNFRKHLEDNSTCNFFIFRGLKYDTKTDRYVASFKTTSGTGERSFDSQVHERCGAVFPCQFGKTWIVVLVADGWRGQ